MKSPESGGYEPHISPELLPKKILWVSRHKPMPLQVDFLREIFGRIQIDLYSNNSHWRSAQKIADFFWQGKYTEIVVILPMSVIARLCEMGINPLWAEMDQIYSSSQADLSYNGRYYKFIGFRRIKEINMIFSDVWDRGETK